MSRRWRARTTVPVSLAATGLLILLLVGRRHEFAAAASSAAPWVLAVAVLGQVVALLARSEAWDLSIGATGGAVERRAFYRASSAPRAAVPIPAVAGPGT